MHFNHLTCPASEARASAAGRPRKGPRALRAKLSATLFVLALACLLAAGAAVKAQVGDEGPTDPPRLVISEFRLSGPGGDLDEFVEIYNNSDAPLTVSAEDGSAGYALVASDGAARFVIPNGTVVPARGHFLGTNSAGYSLSAYPAGNGATAAGDAAYTADIPDNRGIALFATSNPVNFNSGWRLDAAGPTSEGNALYREGAGYPPLSLFRLEGSFMRRLCSAPLTCPGLPRDTGNNAADFLFADTLYSDAGAGENLGAPGPEGLSSPARRAGAGLSTSLFDPQVGAHDYPNLFRDPYDADINAAYGVIRFNRTFTNHTGAAITRLRFRVADVTTAAYPDEATADLRLRSSYPFPMTLTDGSTPEVEGTVREEPPAQGARWGGFNTSLSADSVTPSAPLAPGASVNLQFTAGVEHPGDFRLCLVVETLPAAGSGVLCFDGHTEAQGPTPPPTPTPTPTPTPMPTPPIGCTTLGFSNPLPIVLRYSGVDASTATPYPSAIAVAGFTGPVRKVTVRLSDLSHSYPKSIDVMLVAPDGRNAVIMSDVSTGSPTSGVTLTLDDDADEPLPIYEDLTTGTFRPRNNFEYDNDSFPAPAPATDGRDALSVFRGAEPNGVWSLYVVNDFGLSSGQFAGGWSLEIMAGCQNGPPAAHDDSYQANRNMTLNVSAPGVLANDTDSDGNRLTAALASGPADGTLWFNRDGSFSYTPNQGFEGEDSFTYRAEDGRGGSDEATVRINVTGHAPVARDDSYEVGQNGVLNVPAPGVLANDTDADGDALWTWGYHVGPMHGFVTLNRDGSFTYTPNKGFVGVDSFKYRAEDGKSSSLAATVRINVRDAEPPALAASLAVTSLRQRDSALVNVGLSAEADDGGGPVRISVEVFGDEDDEAPTSAGVVNSPDARDIAPGSLRLRAERADLGDGRVYLVVVTATDAAGNTSRRCLTVVVPKSQSDKSAESVAAQAEAARQYAEANGGAPPPGYFVIGDGPVVGPNQ